MHDSLIPTYSNLGGGLRNKARGEDVSCNGTYRPVNANQLDVMTSEMRLLPCPVIVSQNCAHPLISSCVCVIS